MGNIVNDARLLEGRNDGGAELDRHLVVREDLEAGLIEPAALPFGAIGVEQRWPHELTLEISPRARSHATCTPDALALVSLCS